MSNNNSRSEADKAQNEHGATKKSKFSGWGEKLIRGGNLLAALGIFVAAVVHIFTYGPQAYALYFPSYGFNVLGFYNTQRVTLHNTGNQPLHVLYLQYGLQDQFVRRAVELYGQSVHDSLKSYCKPLQLDEVSCEHWQAKLERRYNRITTRDLKGWSPGQKTPSIAHTWEVGETDVFKLNPNKWSGCPEVPIGFNDNTTCSLEQQKLAVAALFALSYQAFPIRCVEAAYYAEQDQNYQDLMHLEPGLSQASMPGSATVLLSEASHVAEVPMGVVKVLIRYENSAFCASILEHVMGQAVQHSANYCPGPNPDQVWRATAVVPQRSSPICAG